MAVRRRYQRLIGSDYKHMQKAKKYSQKGQGLFKTSSRRADVLKQL